MLFFFCAPPLYKFLATGLVLTKINIQVYNLLIQAYFTYKSTLQDLHFLLLIFSLVSVFKESTGRSSLILFFILTN